MRNKKQQRAIFILWVVTLYGPSSKHQYFGGTQCTIFHTEDLDSVYLRNDSIYLQAHKAS
jgi:hypothetical protein